MADSPVQVFTNEDAEAQGQAQAKTPYPEASDGKHVFSEVRVHTDRVITDVNDPLAVQVPEDSGASSVGALTPLSLSLRKGTPEEQFERAQSENEDKEEKE